MSEMTEERSNPSSNMMALAQLPRVVILLATYNGGSFLSDQLQSFLAQTHANWILFWRDDGSSDDTVLVMESFAAQHGRCVRVTHPPGHVGAAANFFSLIRTVYPMLSADDIVAFSDQDDVWLPSKLSRGVTALEAAEQGVPALYCARLLLVDAALRRIGESAKPKRFPGFSTSLTQNIAAGCTIMLNRQAVAVVASITPPPAAFHDWWCYVLVTATGGAFLYDDHEVILYRQHGGNAVGAPSHMLPRALAAMRRGPKVFMDLLRGHLDVLAAHPEILTKKVREDVVRLQAAVRGGIRQRLLALHALRLRRETVLETVLFWIWFVIG